MSANRPTDAEVASDAARPPDITRYRPLLDFIVGELVRDIEDEAKQVVPLDDNKGG